MIRITLVVDIDTDNLTEAYRDLVAHMNQDNPTIWGWESTDEWFDGDGDQIPLGIIEGIRSPKEEPEPEELLGHKAAMVAAGPWKGSR